MKVLIITEANEKIASGHLMESISLATRLADMQIEYLLLINSDMPVVWKEKLAGLKYGEYIKSLECGMDMIISEAISNRYDVIITDVREITNEQVHSIKKVFKNRLICIDEWGNRLLDCDYIVNNMLDQYYWNYFDSQAIVYAGPQYLMLSEELKNYHRKEKCISDKISNVVISMGGVDSKNNSKKVVNVLKEIENIDTINVVLGGGYLFKEELMSIIGNDKRFFIHQNINYIYDLFENADLAVCAGGNTMYELAGIGTPMIVLPTMPHEKRNGQAFERLGLCRVVDEITEKTIAGFDHGMRLEMSEKEKQLIDGMGLDRIISIILNLDEQFSES